MADEVKRPEDEVEAHGGWVAPEDLNIEGPKAGEDEEPDVEAHGGWVAPEATKATKSTKDLNIE
jgi:hypothetical protein